MVVIAAIVILLTSKQKGLETKIEQVKSAGQKIEQQRLQESKKTIEEQKAREQQYKQNIEQQIEDLKKQVEAKKASKLAQAASTAVSKAVPTVQAAGSHADWLNAAGVPADQQGCATLLINKESGFRVDAYNPSGAYGIPQSLPGSKMASAGADWQTNPVTQIRWMVGYVNARYGGFCQAWSHSQAVNWY